LLRSEKMAEEDIRIGVFVCHCGTNIGGVVDVPKVVEYAKKLPGVVYAERNLYTCAEDGLVTIKNAIKQHKLNRIVVASCTPRTHAPLFQATCEEAGLNKYLFTFVNLREHCSWVHMKEKERATDKAKELVKMGVARVRLLKPQEEEKIPVEPRAMVIGGGVAGMTAALSLADQGFLTYMVEREQDLGGFVRNLNNLYLGGGDATDAIRPMIARRRGHGLIKLYAPAQVIGVDGYVGNFNVKVKHPDGEATLKVGTIIVATGAVEYIPEGLYGYGMYDNVVTLTEFEIMCKAKKLPKVKSVAFIQCVGSRGQKFSYCSRICCNVSIKNALNLIENYGEILGKAETAEKVHVDVKVPGEVMERRRRRRGEEAAPGVAEEDVRRVPKAIDVTIFNRGITAYGVEHELMYNRARERGVRFVKFSLERIPKVMQEGGQLEIIYYHETLKAERKLPVDMIVLATPLVPQKGAKELSQMLKVPLGQDGFFLEAHVKLRPVDFATDGIFVCGSAKGPADITDCVTQALAAASRAGSLMAKGYVQAEALHPVIDGTKCTGCGTCIEVCAYGALRKNEKGVAESIMAACKGCGNCGATCPEGAITMTHYTDEQLLAEVEAALAKEAA
jgi:heterodisulfide reductase subunit A